MEPIEGVGGKRLVKTFPNICLCCVHSSTGELPAPKSTQDVLANFTHLQASQARSLGLGVGNSAHSSNITYLFPKLPSTHRTNFKPKGTFRIKKIYAIQCVLRSGNGAVDAKLCLEWPIWPCLPKEGVTQWWGRPYGIMPVFRTIRNLASASDRTIGGSICSFLRVDYAHEIWFRKFLQLEG